MKRIGQLFFLIALLFSLTSHAQTTTSTKPSFTRLDKIVAIVDREIITQSELDKELETTRKQMEHFSQPIPPQAELRKQVLDLIISKKLQFQVAKAKGLNITSEEVNKTIASIAKSNHITPAQLKEAVIQGGMSYEEYSGQIASQLLLQKVQQEEVAKNLPLTPEDVQKFARENKAKLSRYSTYHLIDIALPLAENSTPSQLAETKKQASDIARQLQAGKDADDVIKSYANAEKNDLGWRAMTEIPSIFQARVAEMQVKNVSQPVQAPNGLHILKLLEAKGDNIRPNENELKNLAFQAKMVTAVKEWVNKLRHDSYIQIMK